MRNFILLFSSILMLVACSNDDGVVEGAVQDTGLSSKSSNKVSVCHKKAGGIDINVAALAAHIAHGDAVDMDGDGFYTGDNPCSDPDFDDAIPFDQSILVDIDGDGFFTTDNPFSAIDFDDDIAFDQSTLVDADGDGFFTTENPFSDVDCDDNAYSLENSCGIIQIGDYYEGGVVFWVDPENSTKGLVCAIQDQYNNNNNVWSNEYTETGATGIAIGTGTSNTNTIIASPSLRGISAAGLARAYPGGGFTDWFLPSKDELNEMYQNKTVINATATDNGGSNMTIYWYWSSTEDVSDSEAAWLQNFGSGNQQSIDKLDQNNNVRAVRAF